MVLSTIDKDVQIERLKKNLEETQIAHRLEQMMRRDKEERIIQLELQLELANHRVTVLQQENDGLRQDALIEHDIAQRAVAGCQKAKSEVVRLTDDVIRLEELVNTVNATTRKKSRIVRPAEKHMKKSQIDWDK